MVILTGAWAELPLLAPGLLLMLLLVAGALWLAGWARQARIVDPATHRIVGLRHRRTASRLVSFLRVRHS
jgi:hypothetical protein